MHSPTMTVVVTIYSHTCPLNGSKNLKGRDGSGSGIWKKYSASAFSIVEYYGRILTYILHSNIYILYKIKQLVWVEQLKYGSLR